MKVRNSIQLLLLFVLVLVLVAAPSLQAEVTATATLNVQTFSVDRSAQLSLTVQGTRSFQPHIAEVDGLRFHQRGQSTRMEYINGDFSASVTFTYLVQADRAGTFTIPPIEIVSKSGDAETSAITFTVTDIQQQSQFRNQSPGAGTATTTRLRSGEAQEVAFMRIIPGKKTSYSGELVPLQIKVYFRDGIQANLNSLPQLAGEGFVLQQLAGEPIRTQEIVANSRYSVLTWNSSLSGIKEGEHMISMELDATLLLRQQRSRRQRPSGMFSDSFFGDSFFNDFFGSYQEKEVKVASPKIKMMVKSLPEEGKPDAFNGAVGDFRLQVQADPLAVAKGDPVTLTMTVSGQGNFDRVQAPELMAAEGWKSYSPSSEFLKDGAGNRGKKVFEQAIVAKKNGLTEIPAIGFSYFDPHSESYKNLLSAPIPLVVRGENKPEVESATVLQQEAVINQDESVQSVQEPDGQGLSGLAPLHLESGLLDKSLQPIVTQKWFQLLLVVLVLLIAVAVIIKKRAQRLAHSPRLQRQQARKRLLPVRLKEIEERRQAADSCGFLVSCRLAIREQLGLLWEMEAAAITGADMQQRMAPDSILLAIVLAAEESAYAGQELSAQQMQEYATAVKGELESLL